MPRLGPRTCSLIQRCTKDTKAPWRLYPHYVVISPLYPDYIPCVTEDTGIRPWRSSILWGWKRYVHQHLGPWPESLRGQSHGWWIFQQATFEYWGCQRVPDISTRFHMIHQAFCVYLIVWNQLSHDDNSAAEISAPKVRSYGSSIAAAASSRWLGPCWMLLQRFVGCLLVVDLLDQLNSLLTISNHQEIWFQVAMFSFKPTCSESEDDDSTRSATDYHVFQTR